MADKRYDIDLVGRDKTGGAIKSAKGGLNSLSADVKNFTSLWGAAAGLLAGAGITRFFSEAIDKSVEFERVQRRLDSVLRATGYSVGITSRELKTMAAQFDDTTLFSENEVASAMTQLATFKSVQGDTFRDAISLSMDLSAVMGQDLKSSVVQLGKALEDPTKGYTALNRVGVSFTETQIEQIKHFQETNELAKAQGVILKTLEGQFGGTAEFEGKGVAGAIDKVNTEWERLLRASANTDFAKGGLNVFFSTVSGGLQSIREEIEKGNWASTYLTILGKAIPGAGPALEVLGKAVGAADEQRRAMGVVGETEMGVEEQRKARETKLEQERATARADAVKLQEETEIAQRKYTAEMIKDALKEISDAEKKLEKERQDRLAAGIERYRVEYEFRQQSDQDIQDAIDAAAEQQAKEDEQAKAKRDRLKDDVDALSDSLASQRELLQNWYQEKADLIDQAERAGIEIAGGYQEQRARLAEEFRKRDLDLHKRANQDKYGTSAYYDRLTLESSQYFFGQMAQLMTVNNRKMFEIGKVAAIGETVIQTYKAAQGAYAALSSIPIVGPALGIAAAAAATLAGFARVQAIQNQSYGTAGGATPVFSASPATGLPTSAAADLPPTAIEQATQAPQPRIVNVQIISDSGVVSTDWIRDQLLPKIEEASGDGVVIRGY